MLKYTYEDVLNQARQLSPEEQLQLLEEIAAMIRQRVKNMQPPKHNVMEFRGIAKGFWKDIDVKKFIEEERNSWE
ncbi:MAG TPA: hypothetical protein VKR83_00575 [Ktedonobacteraceae bacterium]|nr:hypothetical protein [Ktedonobacteraceae bacterium]